jgi:hypothetical protein
MVPIHNTDVAEERWSQAEWENYELWEKIEQRLKKRKRIWILFTVIVFLILSAIPIFMDRWGKWESRFITRQLAQEINWIKTAASIDHAAYRLRLAEGGNLSYIIDRLENCSISNGIQVRSGELAKGGPSREYLWISKDQGVELGIPGLVGEFCYDSLAGARETGIGFGIIPAKDLTEKRMDRISILLLMGQSGEISFD